ncbi:MAG: alpha/beta hydrolase [Thermomicrobiales bacterium]
MRIHTIILEPGSAPFRIALLDLPGRAPERPPRVFLHGLGSSSIATFPEHAAERPQDAPRAILIDLPGFGFSRNAAATWSFSIEAMADLVAAVLRDLGVTGATVIGHSMGGSVAIALAARHPASTGTLIVAEPNLDPGVGTLSSHIAQQGEDAFLARGYGRLLHATTNQAARGDAGAAIYLPTLQQALPTALHRAAASLLEARKPTFREHLHALAMSIPTTFILGDRTPGLTGLDSLGEAGVALATIPNAGHVMMDDNPTAFVAALLAAEDRAAGIDTDPPLPRP